MSKDLKYRFDELIATINLLPDDPEEGFEPVFPNLTRDIAEPELHTALLCQSMKGDYDFQIKMSTTLATSAMNNIMENHSVSPDDLYALSVASNILWAMGNATSLFSTLGLLGQISNHFEVEIPDLACAFLRPNSGAEGFGNLDPYKILAHEYSLKDILEQATKGNVTDINQLLSSLRKVMSGDEGKSDSPTE